MRKCTGISLFLCSADVFIYGEIGSAIGSYALGWVGFVSGAASQTREVAEGILKLYTGLPIIAFLLMLIGVGIIFHLDKQKTSDMYEKLEEKRAQA